MKSEGKSCDSCANKGKKTCTNDVWCINTNYKNYQPLSPDKSEKKSYEELQEKYAELFNDDHYGCDDYPVLKMLKDYTNELLTLIRNKEGK